MSVAVAIPALAHPLGNFTINHYSRVELVGDQARVLYVLDLAEIPTFQEKQRIADDSTYLGRQVEKLSQNLILTVDGKPLPLKMTDHSMQFLPGQGGLQTERLEVSLVGASALPKGQHQAVYRDNNFQGRLGWKEIVVQASAEAQLTNSSVPAASVSQELRKYPQDMLTSPLNVTQASFRFVPGRALTTTGQSAPLKMAGAGLGLVQDRFAALIAPRDLSLPLLGFSLLIAIVLGGLHLSLIHI